MSIGKAILETDKLSTGYGKITVLHDVSLLVEQGELLAIIGQNGSGKSTLLKTLCGLLPLQKGNIKYHGNHVNKLKPHTLVKQGVSCFLQGGLIMPALTVQEHLELAAIQTVRKLQKTSFDVIFVNFPKLKQLQHLRAGNLSGGERQMLSLGMLLMHDTKLWLLDEPTSGLSPEMVLFTADFLKRKNRDEGITMLLVEHNMEVAFRLASHVVIAKEETLTSKFNEAEFHVMNFLNKHLYN